MTCETVVVGLNWVGDNILALPTYKALQHRFRNEGGIAVAVPPNIATLFGLEEHESSSFLVMELVDGRPIDELARDEELDLPARVRLVEQVAEAVAAALQIALPAPISMAVSRSSFSTRVPIQVAAQNTPATTITSITTPARPTPITSWKVTRKPYSTMPARSSMPLA